MLLQSHRGLLRLFPALPATWNDVAFRTLRAEGAFLVSAERQNGRTARAEVSAEAGGLLQLRDPFDSAPFAAIVRGPGGERLAATPELRDGILRLHLPAGATITFSSKGW
jgi:alpha-L-fucosidase 2